MHEVAGFPVRDLQVDSLGSDHRAEISGCGPAGQGIGAVPPGALVRPAAACDNGLAMTTRSDKVRAVTDSATAKKDALDPAAAVASRGGGAGAPDIAAAGSPAGRTSAGEMQIGGMALRNGVLFMAGGHWAAAVRRDDGSIEVRSGKRPLVPGRGAIGRLPLLRGVSRLTESIAVLPAVRRELGPVLPQEDPRVFAAAGAGALAGTVLRHSRRGSPALKESVIAMLTLAPALLALRDSRIAGYHGAEHKSVAASESGKAAAGERKEHERCGSMLVAPLLATSLLGNVALRRLGADRNPVAMLTVGVVSLGVAVELFSWAARNAGHPLAELIKRPGLQLQRMATTSEPDEAQLEVAEAAMSELLRLEGRAPSPA